MVPARQAPPEKCPKTRIDGEWRERRNTDKQKTPRGGKEWHKEYAPKKQRKRGIPIEKPNKERDSSNHAYLICKDAVQALGQLVSLN